MLHLRKLVANLVDGDGRIADRWDNVASTIELEAAIDRIIKDR